MEDNTKIVIIIAIGILALINAIMAISRMEITFGEENSLN